MNYSDILAKISDRKVRVDITKGTHQTRYDVFIPNSDKFAHGEAAVREHAEAAGATGHLSFFPPNTIMADTV